MRIASWLLLLLTLSSIDGCQTPGPPSTARVGLSGGPLARELTVIVLDEATGAELAGATVTCGGASSETALGSAARCDAAALADGTIVVSAPGRVTERWIGISAARAVVALAPSAGPERTLHGAVTGGTDGVSVGLSARFGILRSSDVTGSAVGCADPADCRIALDAPTGPHDLAILDRGAGRLVLVRDLVVDAAGGFVVDVLTQSETARLIDLSVTLPSAVGLTEVVGVPGLSTANGVALLGSMLDGTSTLAPARDGAFAADRLWFVARARTADGSGESFALDRDVPTLGAVVELPSAFLEVPVASREGDVVNIGASGGALVIVESSDGAGVIERAVAFRQVSTVAVPSGATSVRVRAVDAMLGSEIDLGAIAAGATRFADRVL